MHGAGRSLATIQFRWCCCQRLSPLQTGKTQPMIGQELQRSVLGPACRAILASRLHLSTHRTNYSRPHTVYRSLRHCPLIYRLDEFNERLSGSMQ